MRWLPAIVFGLAALVLAYVAIFTFDGWFAAGAFIAAAACITATGVAVDAADDEGRNS